MPTVFGLSSSPLLASPPAGSAAHIGLLATPCRVCRPGSSMGCGSVERPDDGDVLDTGSPVAAGKLADKRAEGKKESLVVYPEAGKEVAIASTLGVRTAFVRSPGYLARRGAAPAAWLGQAALLCQAEHWYCRQTRVMKKVTFDVCIYGHDSMLRREEVLLSVTPVFAADLAAAGAQACP